MLAKVDIAIIGAGVVGLAVAYELSRHGTRTIAVLEKNSSFGMETSSRNSQVIHAGIYYPASLLKTRLCVEGRPKLYDFCRQHRVRHKRLGKLVVTTESGQSDGLEKLRLQAAANGVELRPLSSREIQAMEPSLAVHAALFSPESGIVDVHQLMRNLYHLNLDQGVIFAFHSELLGLEYSGHDYTLSTNRDSFKAAWVINSAGLTSDAIPAMLGLNIDDLNYRIHPCKGEYYRVKRSFSINHLVYPLPGSSGLLGIHITPDMSGQLRLGPNAYDVPNLNYNIDDGHHEAFYQAARLFWPDLHPQDITPDFAGIRPRRQRLNAAAQDFVIQEESGHSYPQFIDMIGIESPGLTSCLAIGAYVRKLIDLA